MTAYPRIATAYDLPFEVLAQPAPLLGGGGTVVLSLVPKSSPTPEALLAFKSVMMHFSVLAEAGALGGDRCPPWQSTIGKTEGPLAVGQNLEWTLAGTNLDERSLAVLVNLLLVAHDQNPLTRVTLRRIGDGRPCVPLAVNPDLEDPYPPQWPQLPFALDLYEEVMETFSLHVQFRRELGDSESEAVENELLSWAGAAMEGAYAVAPIPPQDASLLPDFPITIDGDSLEWSIDKCRTHRGALDGLVNVLVAIHEKVAPITEATLE